MPVRHLILASASPARRRLLTDIGVRPEVMVSGVDEDAVAETEPLKLATTLACAKAHAVIAQVEDTVAPGTLVLGCDSVLEFAGEALGKPADAADARRRWMAFRGEEGTLHTGHCLIAVRGRQAAAVASTVVHFGTPTDAEIDDYVATGEPLGVAGGFTLDGRSAPFVDGIVGDPSNVIGLSLPLLRRLLNDLEVSLADLQWPAR